MRSHLCLIGLVGLAVCAGVSAADSDLRQLYSSGNKRVVLTATPPPRRGALDLYGKEECGSRRFCLIWFFSNETDATKGVQRMSVGEWFDPVPGLFAIYSKNKVVNEIICYEPEGTC